MRSFQKSLHRPAITVVWVNPTICRVHEKARVIDMALSVALWHTRTQLAANAD